MTNDELAKNFKLTHELLEGFIPDEYVKAYVATKMKETQAARDEQERIFQESCEASVKKQDEDLEWERLKWERSLSY